MSLIEGPDMLLESYSVSGSRHGQLGVKKRKNDESKPPRGTHTAYNYFVQCFRDQQKQADPDHKVKISEFSKECGEMWKAMSVEEKEPYQHLAKLDRERYEEEMQYYIPRGEVPKKRKLKKPKDPNAPKRPLTSYLWFCQDERSLVKDSHPEMNGADVTKELGLRWRQIDPEIKQKYQALYEKDKIRYDQEMLYYNPPEPRNIISFEAETR